MIDEGYIKFQCNFTLGEIRDDLDLGELIKVRNELYALGLIGVYPDGIGFGNVSQRILNRQFIISSTQTGHISNATKEHFSLVTNYNIENNSVDCVGQLKASSESMTHAAIYECSKEIRSVLHIHSEKYWNELMNKVPTTPKDVPYGTPEMARAVKDLFHTSDLAESKIFVMAGHREGIVAFGLDSLDARRIIREYCK